VFVRVFKTVAGLRCYLELQQSGDGRESNDRTPGVGLGLVPTMGALHAGHLSLIQRARQENAIVVVSIFVNPLQFAPTEDFQQYPRTLNQDQHLCEQAGVDVLFVPTMAELGIASAPASAMPLTQVVPLASMMSVLCGNSRPGHFQGVATIVTKLLHLVQPNRAYFGQKDAQQVAIIQRLVTDLNVPVEIVPCRIVREPSGLALSSRNQYLTPDQKIQAVALFAGLQQAEQAFRQGERSQEGLVAIVQREVAGTPDLQLEYVELVHPRSLLPLARIDEAGLLAVAARLGTTRLIDNVILRCRQPIVAIDGPAGAGKSTVTRLVAEALGLLHLDTGAMYRAVTWLVLQAGIPLNDVVAIAELVSQCQIELSSQDHPARAGAAQPTVMINGQDVTEAIRSQDVTAQVSAIAAQAVVRRELVKQQQSYGCRGGIVAEGRDIGTQVFPDAELKIFLTASVQERGRRRQQDLKDQGKPEISLDDLEQTIYERDRKDSTRALSPLRQAEDAIEIQSDRLSITQVVEQIVNLYHSKLL